MNNLKRYFQFFLIVLAAGSIYPLLYLRINYQETMLSVYNISPTQLNSIYSILGVSFVLGYFPSGWLADKFSAKNLMFLSLLVCGLTGIWFAQIPSYPIMLVIFIIWGIFAVFTFWSSHLKLVKLIAKKEEEGRFFGILDGGRGLVEAVLATIALFIFSTILGDEADVSNTTAALQGVIYMYSLVMLITSFLILFFVKEETEKKSGKAITKELDKPKYSEIFGNKLVWILGLIIFMAYMLTQTQYYLGGYLETQINLNSTVVGQVTVIMLWMRPFGGIAGGFLGDKFGKSGILVTALGFASIFLILLAMLPVTSPPIYFKVLVVLIGLMIFTVRGLYWSLLGEFKVNPNVLGLSIGFISLIGYLPDFLAPMLNNQFLLLFGENNGQNAYFFFSAVTGIIGILLIFVFKRFIKENEKLIKSK